MTRLADHRPTAITSPRKPPPLAEVASKEAIGFRRVYIVGPVVSPSFLTPRSDAWQGERLGP
ncbi:MAG TPA: hypothetical protein PK777_11420 [Thermoguttaceae bacterium]|nr:hypothetical protein [Thermoguttaceae bacterium]HPP53553.1 hypothetical protein [Thermoguttaceae bacterium]